MAVRRRVLRLGDASVGAIGTTLLIYANHLRIRYRREGIALGALGVGLIVFGVGFVVARMLT